VSADTTPAGDVVPYHDDGRCGILEVTDRREQGGSKMHAHVGDQLIVEGHRIGLPRRTGRVEEARGADDGPPYLVRWDDTGRTTLLFPGPDCRVEHVDAAGKEQS
jgi:hypothetical protein